jgi:hypothetical protein
VTTATRQTEEFFAAGAAWRQLPMAYDHLPPRFFSLRAKPHPAILVPPRGADRQASTRALAGVLSLTRLASTVRCRMAGGRTLDSAKAFTTRRLTSVSKAFS